MGSRRSPVNLLVLAENLLLNVNGYTVEEQAVRAARAQGLIALAQARKGSTKPKPVPANQGTDAPPLADPVPPKPRREQARLTAHAVRDAAKVLLRTRYDDHTLKNGKVNVSKLVGSLFESGEFKQAKDTLRTITRGFRAYLQAYADDIRAGAPPPKPKPRAPRQQPPKPPADLYDLELPPVTPRIAPKPRTEEAVVS